MKGKTFAKKWMGKLVHVTKSYRWDGTVRDSPSPYVGWCVGYAYRRDEIQRDTERLSWEEGGGSIMHARPVGKGRLVIMVCPWPGRKTEDVPPSGVELYDGPAPTSPPEWREGGFAFRYKDEHRKYAEETLDRGPDGRWKKRGVEDD